MKKTYLMSAAIALVAFGMTACGGSTEESAEDNIVIYSLDAEASSLAWKGDYADDSHSHNGKIQITSGTLTYNGDTFESGNFTVDMNSIKDEDLESPVNDTLDKHLAGPYFFNASDFPNTEVTITSISGNEVKATVSVMGKEMQIAFPATIKKTDKMLTAKGTFDIDFSSLGLMGMQEMPEKPKQFVKPVVHFDLNLKMNGENAVQSAD